jgi:hypothetical protein
VLLQFAAVAGYSTHTSLARRVRYLLDERRGQVSHESFPGFRTGGCAVYHTIEFASEITVDLEISPKRWLERLRIRQGERLQAQIKPYVAVADDGPVEVADLFFEDGTVTRKVSFACFSFVD